VSDGEMTEQDCIDVVRVLKHVTKYLKVVPTVPRSDDGDVIRLPRMRRLMQDATAVVEEELFDG
jgi:hypothetical protein